MRLFEKKNSLNLILAKLPLSIFPLSHTAKALLYKLIDSYMATHRGVGYLSFCASGHMALALRNG